MIYLIGYFGFMQPEVIRIATSDASVKSTLAGRASRKLLLYVVPKGSPRKVGWNSGSDLLTWQGNLAVNLERIATWKRIC